MSFKNGAGTRKVSIVVLSWFLRRWSERYFPIMASFLMGFLLGEDAKKCCKVRGVLICDS